MQAPWVLPGTIHTLYNQKPMLVIWVVCCMRRSTTDVCSFGLLFPIDRGKLGRTQSDWFAFCKPIMQIDGVRPVNLGASRIKANPHVASGCYDTVWRDLGSPLNSCQETGGGILAVSRGLFMSTV